MAILAVSQVPGAMSVALGRAGPVAPIFRVGAIPALTERKPQGEELEAAAPDGAENGIAPGGRPSPDPRRAAWIVGEPGPRSGDLPAHPGADRVEGTAPRVPAPASADAGGDPASARQLRGDRPRETGPLERQTKEGLAQLQAEKGRDEGRLSQGQNERSAETLRVVSELSARDVEVRAHEAAHIAAGGRYITGGASYTYERGPDGREYAVGGEVGIDTSPVPGSAAETATKMEIVRAAALAPSDPSAADLGIAAQAAAVEAEALAEMAASQVEEMTKRSTGAVPGTSINMVA